MDDTEDDVRYPSNRYGVNEGYGSSQSPKPPIRSAPYPYEIEDDYIEDNGEDEEELDGEEDDANLRTVAIQRNGVEDEDEDEGNGDVNGDIGDDDDDDIDGDDDDDVHHSDYSRKSGNANLHKHKRKRKLKSLLLSYEFAPRLPAPAATTAAPAPLKPSLGGRNMLADWTEPETFVLLEAWGERFLQRGRKSLRSEQWQEVAEKVSQQSKMERTDTQCRNRLDTLKKKYKKEKEKSNGNGGGKGKWVYFKKMDLLMSSTPQQQPGLSCGVGSGENVFMNPKVYVNRANGVGEIRDSPGNSESPDVDDDSDLLPPKRTRTRGDKNSGGSFKLLADSINKFSEVYEKTESSKRKQMVELEKMRMDFHRELEMQTRQILERAHAEIAKIRQGNYRENDGPAASG